MVLLLTTGEIVKGFPEAVLRDVASHVGGVMLNQDDRPFEDTYSYPSHLWWRIPTHTPEMLLYHVCGLL